MQYGANQPEYDLVVTRDDRALKVSVKGSQDGGCGLIQRYKSPGVSYHDAANHWAADQSPAIVYCLVQFKGVLLGESPRVYLATVDEIVARHNASRSGLGSTILYEEHTYARGAAANSTDRIPKEWRFSDARIEELLQLPKSD